MSLPEDVRQAIKDILWSEARAQHWADLSPTDKSRFYEHWTADPRIGGVLARYMDKAKIRVYIKDSLLKNFASAGLADHSRPFRAAKISSKVPIVESYIKPHGKRLKDGRVISWGRADDWKAVLMAMHERTFGTTHRPFTVVLHGSVGRYKQEPTRKMIEAAAKRLGVDRLVWLDS